MDRITSVAVQNSVMDGGVVVVVATEDGEVFRSKQGRKWESYAGPVPGTTLDPATQEDEAEQPV